MPHLIILDDTAGQLIQTTDAMSKAEVLLNVGYYDDKLTLKGQVEAALGHCVSDVDDLNTCRETLESHTETLAALLPEE